MVSRTKAQWVWRASVLPNKLETTKGKKHRQRAEQKTGIGFPPTRKCPRRVTLAEMLNMGIALCQSVSERERAASRCHWLMSVFDACPNARACVRACVCVRLRACEVVTRQVWPARCTCGCSSNYWTLFTSSGADDGCSHAGLSARKRNADHHHKTPRGQATRGHTRVTRPPLPRLKKVAWPPHVRMSYKNKHVRCHATVTWAWFTFSFLFFGSHWSLRERRPELAKD